MAKSGSKKASLKVVGGHGQPGHNSGATVEQISDDQLQALTRLHADQRTRLVNAEKTAKAARMNHDKIIKSELGPKGLADIKLLEALSTPEGEAALKADLDRQTRVARWAGLQIGHQAEMFGVDDRPIRERAFDEGKRDGMNAETALNPPANYSPGSDGYEGYCEGWYAGQAVLASMVQQTKSEETPVLRPEGNEPAGPDAFDSAADNVPEVAETEDVDPSWPDDEQIEAREPAEVL